MMGCLCHAWQRSFTSRLLSCTPVIPQTFVEVRRWGWGCITNDDDDDFEWPLERDLSKKNPDYIHIQTVDRSRAFLSSSERGSTLLGGCLNQLQMTQQGSGLQSKEIGRGGKKCIVGLLYDNVWVSVQLCVTVRVICHKLSLQSSVWHPAYWHAWAHKPLFFSNSLLPKGVPDDVLQTFSARGHNGMKASSRGPTQVLTQAAVNGPLTLTPHLSSY